MTWFSKSYAKLKDRWRRFENWERTHLWYEEDWSFPVYGTAEDFEARFRFLVPNREKSEFYKKRFRWWDWGTSGYFENGEVGLKVANPFPYSLLMINSCFLISSYYSFFGSLVEDDHSLWLVGSYRSPPGWRTMMLGFVRLFAGLGAIYIVVGIFWAVGAAMFDLPIIEIFEPLGPVVSGAMLILFYFASAYLMRSTFRLLDRGASRRASQLLEEVCGKPSVESLR